MIPYLRKIDFKQE